MATHHDILIVGAGTAGITVAAQLLLKDSSLDIAIIDPSDTHYYQPIWTLVGGGVFDREFSARPQAEVIPSGATWIKDAVKTFAPDKNAITTTSGKDYTYNYLVVAAGLQLDWDKIDGLKGNMGKNGICSNYSYDTVTSTWKTLQNLNGCRAIFTMPPMPIKCAGAPQKIMWLTDHWLRKQGRRDNTEVLFNTTGGAIFGIAKYRAALEKLVEQRDIKTLFEHNLVAVDAAKKEAVFEHMTTKEQQKYAYDMLHVVPPQSSPDFIKKSPLANDAGWVDVHKYTTQHVTYKNVFSLGDCSSLPNSKTGAAIRKQAPVTVENLLAARNNRDLEASYNGYASCPLVTGYGRLILAEFDYDGQPCESFPFNQAQERYSMYALKAYGLPEMYWNGMLKGHV